MKLAHISDLHVTINPLSRKHRPSGKRWAGAANYYVGGRGRHFRDAELRIRRLLEDVDAHAPDHLLCTGDVTQMSWEEEFRRAAELFGPRLEDPEKCTIIPGNHDRYTAQSARERWFERWFGAAAPSSYPAVRRLLGGRLVLVLVDVTRSTGFADSSGWCGEGQLTALDAVLRDPSLQEAFVVLGLHYGLRRRDGRPDRPRHALRDYLDFEALLAQPALKVDLVVHGHMHRAYAVRVAGRRVVCVGSGTDLATGGGWHLLHLDPESGDIRLKRRVWSPETERYVAFEGEIPGSEVLRSDPIPVGLREKNEAINATGASSRG